MLTQQQIDIIVSECQPFNPKRISVFGSYARGENYTESDIDILYEFDSKYTLFDLAGLQGTLQQKLKRDVDLVEFSSIHPRLKKSILSDSKVLYEQ
ncbi:MAG: nucleotidyltransferase [Sphingobacteriales bacterium 41-5]|nr:MAG: nucleotidyltransferase [Sphingobacteriales bacterium 41-5]